MMREKLEALADEWDENYDPYVMMDPTSHLHAEAIRAILAADVEDLESDAQTLRGYINTYGETPAMTWSNREHWKKRAERAESDVEKLKMDAEHLQYERDEAREEGKPLEKSEGQKATEWSQRPTREWEPPASAAIPGGLRGKIEALIPYARHKAGCERLSQASNPQCDCGLQEAIAALAARPVEGEKK